MADLNTADVQYAIDQRARLTKRMVVAFFIGIFASWLWLIILCFAWALMESVTKAKLLNAIDPELRSDDEKVGAGASGRAKGKALILSFPVALSIIAVAAIFKVISQIGA